MNLKTVTWVITGFVICILLYVCNATFNKSWKIAISEERVKKNILLNYKKNKPGFDKLIAYTNDIKTMKEIEFFEDDKFGVRLVSRLLDTTLGPTPLECFSLKDSLNEYIELTKEGGAKIHFGDDLIETDNWTWQFEAASRTPEFKKIIDYTGFSQEQLDFWRDLVEDIKCESIAVSENGDIVMRYDGFNECQYEYRITKDSSKVPENYIKLDQHVYCGLNRQPLFCGSVIYDK